MGSDGEMSEKRELFADIFVGIMSGDKHFVQDKLLLLDPAEVDHLLQGLEWFQEMCASNWIEGKWKGYLGR